MAAEARGSKSCKRLQQLDQFGDSYKMGLDKHGTKMFGTLPGAVASITLKLVVIAYACYKMSFLLERKGVSMTQIVKEDYYNYTDVFTS